MAGMTPEEKQWFERTRGLLGAQRTLVAEQVRAQLVRTGRMADPSLPAGTAEAARAKREDQVQNLVADSSEIAANTIYLEGHAAGGATDLLNQKNTSVAKALAKRDATQVRHDSPTISPTKMLEEAALLAKHNTELADATLERDNYAAKSAPLRALRTGAAAGAATTRIDRVRNAIDVSDPVKRRDYAAMLTAKNKLTGPPPDSDIDKAMRDAAELSFLKQLAGPALERATPGVQPTETQYRDKGRELLLDIEAEQIISAEIAARIAADIDKPDAKGQPQRIVHPAQRKVEVEALVMEIADKYGFTNVAHFISRHGAQRENPDSGQTTIVAPLPTAKAGTLPTLPVNEATTPETTRTHHDAAARVITGVAPDHASATTTSEAGNVPVTDKGGKPPSTEAINIPHYTALGDNIGPASSQHASAKAALYMLDEGVAQAARAVRENPGTRGHTMDVITGQEALGGDMLGVYPEDSGLGASYQVEEAALAEADRLKTLGEHGALSPAIINRRMQQLSKTAGAQSAKVTLLPDDRHGGFTPMTMFSLSDTSEMVVQDKAAAQAARQAADAAAQAAVVGPAALKKLAGRAAAEALEALALALSNENSDLSPAVAADTVVKVEAAALALMGKTARDTAEKNAAKAVGATPASIKLAGDGAETTALALPANTAAATAAGAAAGVRAQVLVDAVIAHRGKGLKKREADSVEGLANVKSKTDAARLAATTSAAQRDKSKDAADKALLTVPAVQRDELLAKAASAAKAQSLQLQDQAAATQAAAALASAEQRTTDGVAQALAFKKRLQDRHNEAKAEQTAAAEGLARIESVIAAAGATVPERLSEELADAQATLAQKNIDLKGAEFAWDQADGLRLLAEAKQAVLLARKLQETAQAELDTALKGSDAGITDAATKKLAAAERVLQEKRQVRDGQRANVAQRLPPGHPALSDEADDAARKAAAAQAAANKSQAAAQALSADLAKEAAAAVGEPAKLALAALVSDSAKATVDEAAAARAETMQAHAAAALAEAQRAIKVLAQGEEAVFKEEQITEAAAWTVKAGEAPKAYEARMKEHLASLGVKPGAGSIQDMLAAHAAEAAKETAAARKRNDAEKDALKAAKKRSKDETQALADTTLAQDALVKQQATKLQAAKDQKALLDAEAEKRRLAAVALAEQARQATEKAAAAQKNPVLTAASSEATAKAEDATAAKKQLDTKTAEQAPLAEAGTQLAARHAQAQAPVAGFEAQIATTRATLAQLQATMDQAAAAVDAMVKANPDDPAIKQATAVQVEQMNQRTRLEATLAQLNDSRGKALENTADLAAQLQAHGKAVQALNAQLSSLQKDSERLAAEASAFRETELRLATEAQAQTKKLAEEATTAQKAGETAHAETAAQVLEAGKAQLAEEAAATKLAEERKQALALAQAKLDAAEAEKLKSQKALDKIKPVADRIAAELDMREKQDKANMQRTQADIAARMADALLATDAGNVPKQQAAIKAKLLLALADKQVAQAQAEAELLAANTELSTAEARLAAASQTHATALPKLPADRSAAEARVIADWAAMKPKLEKTRDDALEAPAKAKLRLTLAEKQALQAQAEADLLAAETELSAATTRLAAASLAHATALSKLPADRSADEADVIAGWAAMKPELEASRDKALDARDKQKLACPAAEVDTAKALAAAKAGGAVA